MTTMHYETPPMHPSRKHPKTRDVCFLLLPGFAPDAVPVSKLRELCAAKGYPAVAANFFGNRRVDDFSRLTIEEAKEGVSELINELAAKHEEVIGIGISLGGALLFEHAKKNKNLAGIVSIGTPYRLRNRALLRLGIVLVPIVNPLWKRIGKNRRWLPIGAMRTVVDYLEYEFPRLLETISTPTLLLHSKRDLVTDYRAIPEFFSKISSQPKERYLFENGNHVIGDVIGDDLDIVWDQMKGFFGFDS